MRIRSLAVCVLFALGLGAGGAEPTLGDKVAAFCADRKGEQVGSGECSALAGEALKAVGARGRGPDEPEKGDYTWGKLVYRLEVGEKGLRSEGKRAELKPGDVIQFRDTRLAGRAGKNRTYSMSFPHHTAVVAGIEDKGATVKIYHQNFKGKKVVMDETLRLDDLKEGWIRVYRPVPAGDGDSV